MAAAGRRVARASLAATVRHLAAAPVREKAVPGVPGGESGDPAAGVAGTDRMRRLLAQLPERWAHALWPAEAEGLPPGGIGARLGVRRGATAVLVHRVRERLRSACLRACPGSPHRPSYAGHWAAPAGNADCRRRPALLRRVDLGLAGPAGGAHWRCRPRCWGPRRASRGSAAASPGRGGPPGRRAARRRRRGRLHGRRDGPARRPGGVRGERPAVPREGVVRAARPEWDARHRTSATPWSAPRKGLGWAGSTTARRPRETGLEPALTCDDPVRRP
ncbi:hypothetical protein TR51_24455 [Kitasatospora griseola]|uniref:RNA polymerase sigma factor 70 region 4 type 2 domain-containing protein n=1 Tax=Kitasatospora griseola TaxID=2064 RepID=A0A0D0PUK5_KITGR|nr:hypothetical protein TR51_24455 [Kitasatospora griseola]